MFIYLNFSQKFYEAILTHRAHLILLYSLLHKKNGWLRPTKLIILTSGSQLSLESWHNAFENPVSGVKHAGSDSLGLPFICFEFGQITYLV